MLFKDGINKVDITILISICIMAILLLCTPLYFNVGFGLVFVYLLGNDVGNWIYDKYFMKEDIVK